MSDSSERLQNRLDVRLKDLRKVILLRECSCLARPVNKKQRALIAISNSSPRVNRYYMAPVKLVLNTGRAGPLSPFSCDFFFYCPPSN